MNGYELTAILIAMLVSSEILTLILLLYFALKLGLRLLDAAAAERNAYGKKYF